MKTKIEYGTTIREALMGASRFFEERGITSPLFNAETLLMHVLGVDKARLLFIWQEGFAEEQRERFAELVMRRGAHEPLQYLTGVQEFYGRAFQVSPSVLIPRPETEILIEEVMKQKAHFAQPPLIVDIGTGSGAIAVTLALEWEGAQVIAVDLSPDALAVARGNAERLGASDRVEFVQGDLVTPILMRGLRPAIIVSNPPYIPSADCEELDAEVRDHEPRLALDGGDDGLYPYRIISAALPRLWPPAGPAYIAYEVGIYQDQDVEKMIAEAVPGAETGIVPDWQGIGRVIWGRRG